MRLIRTAVAAAALLSMLIFAVGARAESVTVKGTGDIKKMAVQNGGSTLTVKVYGLDAPCDARSLNIFAFWGDKPAYRVEAGCYPGGAWLASLWYTANRRSGNPADSKRVKCPKFKLKYRAGVYTATLPRSCLRRAPDRIRVRSEGLNVTSVRGGKAGATRSLRRG